MLELRQGLQNTSQSERGDWLRLKQSQEQTRRGKRLREGKKGPQKGSGPIVFGTSIALESCVLEF